MPVYVFQRFDVIGGGRGRLVEMIRSRCAAHLEDEYGVRLVGVWATAGSTASWPEANALWEMDDWEHFARAQQAQFPREDKDPYGVELGRHCLAWQSGGESALLVGAPFSPPLARLRADGIEAQVVLLENVKSKPGGMDAYHRALEFDYLPIARSRGLRLLGAYRHALSPNRGLNLWALQSWEHARDLMESEDGHDALQEWNAELGDLLEDAEGWLLAPPPQGLLRT
jgi:hypothetical protein